jgi:hypothetical protein
MASDYSLVMDLLMEKLWFFQRRLPWLWLFQALLGQRLGHGLFHPLKRHFCKLNHQPFMIAQFFRLTKL